MILFHDSGCLCLKHFYLEKVYKWYLQFIACFTRSRASMCKGRWIQNLFYSEFVELMLVYTIYQN